MRTSKKIADATVSIVRSISSAISSFFKILFKKMCFHGNAVLKKLDNHLCATKHSLLFLAWLSFLMNYLLEAALRLSLIEPVILLIKSPHVFLLGVLIVFASMSPLYLFKRRSFYFALIFSVWVIITCVSFVLMLFRTTPFNSSDFKVLKSAIDIIPIYLSVFDMVLIAVAVILTAFLLIQIFRKCRKSRGFKNLTSLIPLFACSITAVCAVCNTVFVVDADRFDNLPNKYREHGFAFCFLYSIIDTGIPMPEEYTQDAFADLLEDNNKKFEGCEKPLLTCDFSQDNELISGIYNMVMEAYQEMPDYAYLDFSSEMSQNVQNHISEKYNSFSMNASNASAFPKNFERPNVIFLQLESFYDVNNIEGYEYSKAPHPVYSLLKDKLPGGNLSVPSIGAGTANTEFEVITGMDVSLFGIAEYPYLSVLQDNTCESIANNTRPYGYTTHAIHNHNATFYDRNLVFQNLGFDTFTSIETTPHIYRNMNNWAKDTTLIEPILASLDYSENQDLIYSISVQPHGKYPSEDDYADFLEGEEPRILVFGNEDNPENPGFTYYVNELHEADTFLGNLILELYFRNEPTVLVFYGDHLPAFSVQTYWTLKEGDCYQTDYMIWNNCGIDFSDAKDLKTYQLASYIFSKLGIDSGNFNRLNRNNLENHIDDYTNERHFYQYATLYDSALKEVIPHIDVPDYPVIDTKYGIFPIIINDVFTLDDTTVIVGENFNEYTVLTVNDEMVETEFINSTTLITTEELNPGDIMSTLQKASSNVVISQSDTTLTYTEQMAAPQDDLSEFVDLINSIIGNDEAVFEEDAESDTH